MDLINREELIEKLNKFEVDTHECAECYSSVTEIIEAIEYIGVLIDEVPTVEAVPAVHLDTEKSEILDTLDKMQFFLGQRAGRELWNDKPEDVQEKDLENFNKDIEKIKEYLLNVKPVERGEWKEYSYNQFMGLDDLGEPKFKESIDYRCTKCDLNSVVKHSFCPRCGRDMRKLV